MILPLHATPHPPLRDYWPRQGQVKGVRLFHLGSILDFVAKCEAKANAELEALQ